MLFVATGVLVFGTGSISFGAGVTLKGIGLAAIGGIVLILVLTTPRVA